MNVLKRSIKSIAAAVCAVILFSTSVSAQSVPKGFSMADLSQLGLPSVKPSMVSNWQGDAVISDGEYGSYSRYCVGNGLAYTNSSGNVLASGESFQGNAASCYEDVRISYDHDYLYFASYFSSEAANQLCAVEHPLYGKVKLFVLELRLKTEENPFLPQGVFTNSYYFSDSSCVGVTGVRTAKVGSDLKVMGRIATQGNETPFSSDMLGRWDGKRYQNEAFFATSSDGSAVFECRIPLEDVALTLVESERSAVLSAIRTHSEFVCGSFAFKSAVRDSFSFSDGSVDHLMMSIGISPSAVCPLSETGASWRDVLSDFYCASDSDAFSFLSVPLYWGERTALPVDDISSESASQTSGQATLDNQNNEVVDAPSSATAMEQAPSLPLDENEGDVLEEHVSTDQEKTEPVPNLSDVLSDLDFSDFGSDDVPETKVVLIDTENEEQGESNSDLTPSPQFVFVVGVFLLCSIVGLALIYRFAENREIRLENKKRNKKT